MSPVAHFTHSNDDPKPGTRCPCRGSSPLLSASRKIGHRPCPPSAFRNCQARTGRHCHPAWANLTPLGTSWHRHARQSHACLLSPHIRGPPPVLVPELPLVGWIGHQEQMPAESRTMLFKCRVDGTVAFTSSTDFRTRTAPLRPADKAHVGDTRLQKQHLSGGWSLKTLSLRALCL